MSFKPASQTVGFNDHHSERLRDELLSRYLDLPLRKIPTPAMIIDQSVFSRNCAEMHHRCKQWGWKFRAHIKSHKTAEGTRLQLRSSVDSTHAVVVSTLPEVKHLVRSGLVADGTVKDILYGLPVGINKLAELAEISDSIQPHGAVLRILVDSPEHVRALEALSLNAGEPWSVFFKVNLGTTKRAGLVPHTDQFLNLLRTVLDSPAVILHGFYTHAGTSYASKSLQDASDYLTAEITAALDAVQVTYANFPASKIPPLVLSVGSTPTAHAFSPEALAGLQARQDKVAGSGKVEFELHAGNYAMLDLQQIATSLVSLPSVSQRVLASVISYYPGRGKNAQGEEEDEAMCDAGAVAMSKDTGPIPGFGDVVRIIRSSSSDPEEERVNLNDGNGKSDSGLGIGTTQEETGWCLGRISQEHGILTRKPTAGPVGQAQTLRVGDMIEIVGQHACLIAAAHPWYYILNTSAADQGWLDPAGDQRVVDIWVPCKGW